MKGEKLGFYEIWRRGTRNLARNGVSKVCARSRKSSKKWVERSGGL